MYIKFIHFTSSPDSTTAALTYANVISLIYFWSLGRIMQQMCMFKNIRSVSRERCPGPNLCFEGRELHNRNMSER